jgi:hypothetical protein
MSPAKCLALILPLNAAVIAAAVIRGISKAEKPGLYFGEGRFTMIFSCVQLLAIAFLSFAIFRTRRGFSSERGWLALQNLWLLIGVGFIFLTADEAFEIHENTDRLFHVWFGVTQTNLTDLLDDFIIGSYLLIGVVTLWIFRAELKSFREMIVPLIWGFVCGGFSVVSDILGHHKDIFLALGADLRLSGRLVQWADVGDGAFTLLAEGCFVSAFFAAWLKSRIAPAPAPSWVGGEKIKRSANRGIAI